MGGKKKGGGKAKKGGGKGKGEGDLDPEEANHQL